MSLLEKVQAQQNKRKQASELQVVDETPTLIPASPPTPTPTTAAAPTLDVQQERQTRQLGYRVSVDTLHRLEAYRDKLNALARKKGLQRQSFGDLTELALKLLMEHDPHAVLGLR